MKKFTLLSLVAIALISLQSCEVIGDIFKAGMWWGIIVVVAVIGLILWLFGKAKK
ncbi:phosphatidate cytidylyltransferase [Halpernia sp.]|uniref:phosphatidate cytidylyltransferase n=1 Tax=Halpernia sp. TaxID=2782209 RepID=UPI003A959506